MKQMLIIALAFASCAAFAQGGAKAPAKQNSAKMAPKAVLVKNSKYMSLADARRSIDKAVSNPKTMTAVMRSLSPTDQKTFVAEVNAAIAKMPGSVEERAALFLNTSTAALKGASKGNLANVVAEIYATVTPEALTVVNERLAEDVFNRSSDPKVTYTDAQYAKIAENLMKVVNTRLEKADNAAVRSGFAGLMMIRASNTQSPEIVNAVVTTMPIAAQETARNEWFPAALAEGQSQSYEPMLGMADSEVSRPVDEIVLRIAGPQNQESLLSDLSGASTDVLLKPGTDNPVVDAVNNPLVYELPNLGNGGANETTAPEGKVEPGGYQWQKT